MYNNSIDIGLLLEAVSESLTLSPFVVRMTNVNPSAGSVFYYATGVCRENLESDWGRSIRLMNPNFFSSGIYILPYILNEVKGVKTYVR